MLRKNNHLGRTSSRRNDAHLVLEEGVFSGPTIRSRRAINPRQEIVSIQAPRDVLGGTGGTYYDDGPPDHPSTFGQFARKYCLPHEGMEGTDIAATPVV